MIRISAMITPTMSTSTRVNAPSRRFGYFIPYYSRLKKSLST